MGEYDASAGSLDASEMRFAVVAARFNREFTDLLLDGTERALKDAGASQVEVAWVPGAFELPLAAQWFAASARFDAVICLGAVIRGDTAHFEFVAGECAAGIQRVALDTGVPVVFGVLTVDTRQQAFERVGGRHGHKGEEAAATAIEMVTLRREAR